MSQQVDTVAEIGTDPSGVARRWQMELKLAKKERKNWLAQCKKIVQRYREERPQTQSEERRFNVLWSNMQTLQPAMYNRAPKAEVDRRFKDSDPVGRTASQILERALDFAIENNGLHDNVKGSVFDYLLCGLGVTWERYVPHYQSVTPRVGVMRVPKFSEDGFEITDTVEAEYMAEDGSPVDPDHVKMDEQGLHKDGEPYDEIAFEESITDYLHYSDFLHNPARTWNEVRWVARRAYLTKDAGKERFGDVFEKVPLKHKPDGLMEDATTVETQEMFSKAVVWEIWNKEDKKTYWIVEGFDLPLDVKDDPLGLKSFFPCPKPLLSSMTNDTLVPVPDYVQYQDQAIQLDELTNRIHLLTDALKVAGVYDSQNDSVKRLLEEGVENELIPVDTWAAFAEKGGLKGVVDWLPIEMIATVLQGLLAQREKVKADLYEITGMSDIIRGATDPDETAKAQQIKGRFVILRLEDRQNEVARFVRDIIRIKAEVISEHFQPMTLRLMSGFDLSGQDPQLFDQAIQLLKSDAQRGFRVDIETNSTIAIDEQQEKQSRIEFLASVGGFLQQAMPMLQEVPQLLPLYGEMIMFGVRAFKAGRQLEGAFETAIQQLGQVAQQKAQQPPQPDPHVIKAQSQAQAVQAQVQIQAQKTQGELQIDAARQAAELQMEKQSHAAQQLSHELTIANKIADFHLKNSGVN